jgi:hypothetical protein
VGKEGWMDLWLSSLHRQIKVKLVVIKFTYYTLIWWDQLVLNNKRNSERLIDSWDDMKTIMRKQFVSNFYYRELFKIVEFTSRAKTCGRLPQENKNCNDQGWCGWR